MNNTSAPPSTSALVVGAGPPLPDDWDKFIARNRAAFEAQQRSKKAHLDNGNNDTIATGESTQDVAISGLSADASEPCQRAGSSNVSSSDRPGPSDQGAGKRKVMSVNEYAEEKKRRKALSGNAIADGHSMALDRSTANEGALSTKVWADFGHFLITTPNCDFVPTLDLVVQRIVLRKDMRYGPHDPTVTPIPYGRGYYFAATIPRKHALDLGEYGVLWHDLDRNSDFVEMPEREAHGQFVHYKDYGRLSQDLTDRVSTLTATLRNRMAAKWESHLQIFIDAMSQNDLSLQRQGTWFQLCGWLRFWQRSALDIVGILTWRKQLHQLKNGLEVIPVNDACMGAIVEDPNDAILLASRGIPCWRIVKKWSTSTNSSNPAYPVIADMVQHRVKPTDCVSERAFWHTAGGLSISNKFARKWGDDVHSIVRSMSIFTEPDMYEPLPQPAKLQQRIEDLPPVLYARTRKGHCVSGVDVKVDFFKKFIDGPTASTEEPSGRYPYMMPSTIVEPWFQALKTLNMVGNRKLLVRFNTDAIHGYPVPDPLSFVAKAKLDECHHLVCGWILVAKHVLLPLETIGSVGSKRYYRTVWADALMEASRRTGSRKRGDPVKMKDRQRAAFNTVFGDLDQSSFGDKLSFGWFRDLSTDDVKLLDAYSDFKSLMWHLQEINFRIELRDMHCLQATGESFNAPVDVVDHLLGLFDDRSFMPTKVPGGSNSDEGLNSSDWRVMGSTFRLLAIIMQTWKWEVPREISAISLQRTDYRDTELKIAENVAKVYCQAFYDTYNRPPSIPYRLRDCWTTRPPLADR